MFGTRFARPRCATHLSLTGRPGIVTYSMCSDTSKSLISKRHGRLSCHFSRASKLNSCDATATRELLSGGRGAPPEQLTQNSQSVVTKPQYARSAAWPARLLSVHTAGHIHQETGDCPTGHGERGLPGGRIAGRLEQPLVDGDWEHCDWKNHHPLPVAPVVADHLLSRR